MNIKRNFTFLYMPEDHSEVRQFRVPRAAIAGLALTLTVLIVAAVFYVLSLGHGSGWLPGGSRLEQENLQLADEIDRLNVQVTDLQAEMSEVFRLQEMVALAVDIEPLDPDTRQVGVGGRGHLILRNEEVPPLMPRDQHQDVADVLDKLLRQAKVQYQGYQAILDTLASRTYVLEHIPSIRPVDTGWLSSRFGMRTDPFTGKMTFHRGLDYSNPQGTPVRATADGKVVAVQQQRGLGNVLKIDHGNNVVTVYAHLRKSLVKKGDLVKRGDFIAESGNSGRSTAPHLHYEIRVNGRAINPLSYILDSYAAHN